jgi:hypothetical protein
MLSIIIQPSLVTNRGFIDANELPVLLAEPLCADVIVNVQPVSKLRVPVGEYQGSFPEHNLEPCIPNLHFSFLLLCAAVLYAFIINRFGL